jgi:hypothetical protein
MMTGESGVLILAGLWLALCFRFWRLVGRTNPGQRRLLAVAGGLGAGLIYLLGHLVLGVLRAPSRNDREAMQVPLSGETIRVAPAAESSK